MKELYFKAELLDDIVLSQRMATAGDHKSLDYIPGTTILGALAGRFYSDFGADKAWDIFNSSKVCFCNAYPMMNNKRSIPMPLSFHSEKVPAPGKENEVLNFVLNKGDEKIQYRQNRTGYVDFEGDKLNVCSVEKTSRMRTAIDAKTGSAAKSQLYGYESINAGQVFAGKILWDESVESYDEFQKVIEIFKNGDVLHIGRSRTASYGRVKISLINVVSVESQKIEGNCFSVLALSDLCLRNPLTGRAELQLLPDFLGLNSKDWVIDSEHAFTRPNTIYQYNGHRRELEIQKTLITKGSVFTFKSKSGRVLSPEEIASISEKIINGVGTSRGQGYGEISLLDAKEKYEKIVYLQVNNTKKELSAEEKSWLEWLGTYSDSDDVKFIVEKAVADFKELCKDIKAYYKYSFFLPKKNQWNEIRSISNDAKDKESIIYSLFEGINPKIKSIKIENENNKTKVKDPDPDWNMKGSMNKSLLEWLKEFVETLTDKNIKIALQDLCKECGYLVEHDKWLEEVR